MTRPTDSPGTVPPRKILLAQIRMASWPLPMDGIALAWAYLSLPPFESHVTSTQNVVCGLLAASPFWISIGIFLALIGRDVRRNSAPGQKEP